jgi:molecular chaperone HscB
MLDFSKSYFELFGLPERFELDTELLAERYRELQRVVHPDRYANASDQERRLAVQGASLVNEALQTLRDPLARGRYLVARRGLLLDAGQETTTDSVFLMEQMALREALAEARDQPDPYRVISDIMGRLRQQREALIEALGRHLSHADDGHLEQAREDLRKLQFLEKLRHAAEELEARLDEEL